MSLSFGLNPLLLLLCLLVAGGLTLWSYRHTVPQLSTGRRLLLMSLRFLALFLILFLLFEPVLRRLRLETRPPVLAVLVDESQSLGLSGEADGNPFDLGEAVRQAMRDLPADALGGETPIFTFAGSVAPLGVGGVDSIAFAGERTNIAHALDHIRDELRDQNLKGVLLVSDGQYNTGRNPLYLAERYPVPIYTVAVGDTISRRDVQIRRVTTNEIAYIGTEMPIQVGLYTEDYGGERVTVSLVQNGAVLGTTSTRLPDGIAEVPMDLSFMPEREGLQRLTVAVTRLDGEATYRNNTETVTVRVLESRRRLLLLAAAPDPDVAALRQLLEADPDAEVTTLIPKTGTTYYEGTFPAALDDFDAIVLAGFPGRTASQDVIRRVVEAAENGMPLLFLLGRQTDLRRLQQNFGDVLPVVPRTARPGFVETAFIAKDLQHPILALPSVPAARWQRLPPLYYSESRWQTSPDARVLATNQIRGIPLDDPLLVIRRRSGSRSAALLGAGTWRWKNVNEDLDDVAPFWPELLENLIQWVATREDDRLVRVAPTANAFGGDEPVQLNGQVYDESLNPVSDAALDVEVTAPDGTRFPYSMEAVGNGRYLLDIGGLPEGTYSYTATAEREGRALGADNGSFAVGALTLEFKETQANTALMRQIATRSGGHFMLPQQIGTLPDAVAASGTFNPIVIEETLETKLWQRYAFLIAILLLLTLEWLFRKRSGMV